MSDKLFSKKKSGYEVKVYPDRYAPNPQIEWDNLGVFRITGHYDLRLEALNNVPLGAPEGVPAAVFFHLGWRPDTGQIVILADGDTAYRWYLGHVLVKRSGILKSYFHGQDCPTEEEYKSACKTAKKVVKSEIEVLNMWLAGEVFGYVLEGPNGEHVDSLWGLYGLDYAKEEAMGALSRATGN